MSVLRVGEGRVFPGSHRQIDNVMRNATLGEGGPGFEGPDVECAFSVLLGAERIGTLVRKFDGRFDAVAVAFDGTTVRHTGILSELEGIAHVAAVYIGLPMDHPDFRQGIDVIRFVMAPESAGVLMGLRENRKNGKKEGRWPKTKSRR